jgi:AbiJ N-terminal domain 4
MLFRQRQTQEAMAAAEAAGESLWKDGFSREARVRIWHAFQGTFDVPAVCTYGSAWYDICNRVRGLIVVDEGWSELRGQHSADDDLWAFLGSCEDEEVCSLIEAMFLTVAEIYQSRQQWLSGKSFTAAVNDALYRERVPYEFIQGRMVARVSEELHEQVVAPALRLLAGRPEWAAIETAYRKAIDEIADGEPDDAITDAGTALQEALTLLGCDGNALGPLIGSARTKGLLAQHDSTLADGIAKIMHWVSADRSQLGDGHHTSSATRADAWFTVHVVGALILRLAEGPRPQP